MQVSPIVHKLSPYSKKVKNEVETKVKYKPIPILKPLTTKLEI